MRKPDPAPDADGQVVVVKPRAWDHPAVEVTVTLLPQRFNTSKWEVYRDGEWVGTVGRYTGSLDRPISRGSRIRHEGKKRTLWHYRSPDSGETLYGMYSRADCIRSLTRLKRA